MNKEQLEQIERIALEVCTEMHNYAIGATEVCDFATRFLARIDAERGKDATAWRVLNRDFKDTLRLTEPTVGASYLNTEGYTWIPLFLSPTIPEAMVQVTIAPTPKMVGSTWNEGVYYPAESHNARNKRIYKAMIAAAAKENEKC